MRGSDLVVKMVVVVVVPRQERRKEDCDEIGSGGVGRLMMI